MRLLVPEPISGAEMIISLGFLSLASIALGAAAGTWLEAEYLPLGTWLGELGGWLVGAALKFCDDFDDFQT